MGAAIAICHERAPKVASACATPDFGEFQHIRRTYSGVIIFSRGIDSSLARSSRRALAWVRGAYFSGKRSRQIFIGGKVSESERVAGQSASGKARACVIALIQRSLFSSQRARKPIGRSARSKSFLLFISLTRATPESSTIAASESKRPCEISNCLASS